MALHLVFSQRAQSLADAQTTYKQSVIYVNTQTTGVYSSQLGVLNTLPPDWQDFVNAHEQAQADALDWINNVMARLLTVPANVQGYNSTISLALQDANSQAQTLIANPNNAGAKSALASDVALVKSQVSLVAAFIEATVTAIQGYQNKIPDMAAQLKAIADKSSADAGADQGKIDELNAAIAQLNSDIKSLTAAIVGLAIADGIALTLGLVVTVAGWPFGALVWIMLAPAVAVATTYIALDADKIKADNALISQKQADITGITQDVAVLQGMASQYSAMAAGTAEIQSHLDNVLTEWQALDSEVTAAVNDILAAISDEQTPNYQAVASDIVQASTAWNQAYDQAGSLAIQINVNNAQLAPGMSQQQVQAALATGTTQDLVQYFNAA